MALKKEAMTPVQVLDLILLRKWLLIIPLAAGTIIGLLVALAMPTRYRSTTLILVEQQQVPEEYVMPTDKTPFVERLNTIKQQILSRSRLEQVLNDYSLYQDGDSSALTSPVGWAKGKLGLQASAGTAVEDRIELLRSDIDIKVLGDNKRGGDAFSINYTGKDPYLTMQVTNTLSSFFIDENLKARELYAEGTSEFLANELDKAKQELEVQERALRRFKEGRMGSLPTQLEANLRTLDRLQMELQAVNTQTRSMEDRMNIQQELVSEGILPANSLDAELASLKKELSSLLSVYSESYPDVVIVKNRISELEAKKKTGGSSSRAGLIRTEGGGYADADSQLAVLKQRESEIRKQIKDYERRVEETPANEQRMVDLRRDYDMSLKNYQSLLEKKLSARLAENMEKRQKGERFKVIDPPNLPEKPFRNNKWKITLGGTAAGAGAGLGIIFLIEYLNPAFRKPEELEGLIPGPVLATIPEFYTKPQDKKKKAGLKLVNGGR